MEAQVIFFVLLLLVGCAQPVTKQPRSERTLVPNTQVIAHAYGSSQAQSQDVANTSLLHLFWQPGDYSNFVVVCSPDLTVPIVNWPVFTITNQTNLPVPFDQPQQFFTLYGTNSDGDSAWVMP